MFDVTMGSFDGAEVCELIGLYILNILSDKYGKNNVGLYRDDGLVLLRNTSGPQSERTRKDITREFKKQGLDITISTNLKICNFLDVTLNLKDGTYYPYRKPNNETLYINTNSNHPPTIIKHLPSCNRPTNLGHFFKQRTFLTRPSHTTKTHSDKADTTKN